MQWSNHRCREPKDHEKERKEDCGNAVGDAQDFDAGAVESSPAFGRAATREVFEKISEGRFAIFVIKGESPSNLRASGILKKHEELAKAWYYADRTMGNYDNAEMAPGLRRLVPEWYDKGTGQVNLWPTTRDLGRGNLEKRTGNFARGDIGILLASFAMHSDGKIPDVQVEKIEKWLRNRAKSDKRALRALPGKVARRSTVGQPGARAARSRSRAEPAKRALRTTSPRFVAKQPDVRSVGILFT